MSKRLLTPLLAALAAGLLVAGCGGDDTKQAASTTASTMSGGKAAGSEAVATETGAAELRAGLTGLLSEHVYLAGIAVSQGVGSGLDSAQFRAAAAALDENSKGLSEAVGSVYGDDAGKQFLALWRKHIGMFVEYTKGKAAKDAELAAKAQADLDGYRTDFGAFIASANPNLPADAVAQELKPHVASLSAAIDSVVAGKANAFERLQAAASHMPMTAKVLAGGIATQFPDKFSGKADSEASELRSGLTALLNEHVYLAGIAVVNGVGNGLDSGEFKAAAATLDANSKGLADAVGSVYGDDAGKQFLALWRKHIGMFVDYTAGLATKDAKRARRAQAELDGYRTDFGAFIASANPNLPADAVAQELKPHVASLSAAIRSVVKGKGDAFAKLRAAAGHMPMTAKVLSGGIATQFPERFAG